MRAAPHFNFYKRVMLAGSCPRACAREDLFGLREKTSLYQPILKSEEV
jgi:hypothetical protein